MEVKNNTVVREDRCYNLYKFSQHCSHFQGDFAECGVYKGGTAYILANTLKDKSINDKKIHLFDTFCGMPEITDQDLCTLKKGDFGDVCLNSVKEYLDKFPFIEYYPGVIPTTFPAVKNNKFCLVHIDVDIYQTTLDCCNFFYNRLVSGGIMVFDDYGFIDYRYSEKKAVDEFFKDKQETVISLHSGQSYIIKL